MARFIKSICLAGAVLLFVFTGLSGVAQQNPQRLVLKDGSYQTVTKFEVAGNRVRYYSAERYAWEELPRDLIDWPATEKFNKERAALRDEEVQQATKEDDGPEEPEPPMVAPGLYLPDDGGVFLLDEYDRQPALGELSQNGGELNKQTGRNILRAAINPLALSSRQTIEIKGVRAQVQSHLTQPAIYVKVDSSPTGPAMQQPSGKAVTQKENDKNQSKTEAAAGPPPERFGIVRMERKKDARVVGNLKVAVYGKVSQKQNWITIVSAPAGAGWTKITPAEPLAPGEYAVVEILDKGQINLYVWDFGVDRAAPANAHAWTARKSTTGQGDDKPVLGKRPPD